mmetsp:Transcript_12159/g.18792  ORF Transcript_12159/g.18792 Transcript_12159/m.18792 type:complete len:80 (+) Transcript_12159:6330-6569(+)
MYENDSNIYFNFLQNQRQHQTYSIEPPGTAEGPGTYSPRMKTLQNLTNRFASSKKYDEIQYSPKSLSNDPNPKHDSSSK